MQITILLLCLVEYAHYVYFSLIVGNSLEWKMENNKSI